LLEGKHVSSTAILPLAAVPASATHLDNTGCDFSSKFNENEVGTAELLCLSRDVMDLLKGEHMHRRRLTLMT